MKLTLKDGKEVEVKFLKMILPINLNEIPHDFPFRNLGNWEPIINIETGQILNWKTGKSGVVEFNVNNEGKYYLLGEDSVVLLKKEGGYVPNELIPGWHGETVQLEINELGKIMNWYTEPSLEGFLKD